MKKPGARSQSETSKPAANIIRFPSRYRGSFSTSQARERRRAQADFLRASANLHEEAARA